MAAGMFDGTVILYNNLIAVEVAQLQHINKIDLNVKTSDPIFVY
jgi:hypothetical protein